jgi:hypothetical protein
MCWQHHITNRLSSITNVAPNTNRFDLIVVVEDLKKMVSGLEGRVTALEKGSSTTKAPTATPATHYPDSKPTSLCSFSLMLRAK